jgi:hypothetical protein
VELLLAFGATASDVAILELDFGALNDFASFFNSVQYGGLHPEWAGILRL